MEYEAFCEEVQTQQSGFQNQLEDRLIASSENSDEQEEGEEGEDSDEDGEMPEDLLDLEPAEQQKWLIIRSLYTMGLGTLIVMLFSDPMVSVFDAMGTAINVDNF